MTGSVEPPALPNFRLSKSARQLFCVVRDCPSTGYAPSRRRATRSRHLTRGFDSSPSAQNCPRAGNRPGCCPDNPFLAISGRGSQNRLRSGHTGQSATNDAGPGCQGARSTGRVIPGTVGSCRGLEAAVAWRAHRPGSRGGCRPSQGRLGRSPIGADRVRPRFARVRSWTSARSDPRRMNHRGPGSLR